MQKSEEERDLSMGHFRIDFSRLEGLIAVITQAWTIRTLQPYRRQELLGSVIWITVNPADINPVLCFEIVGGILDYTIQNVQGLFLGVIGLRDLFRVFDVIQNPVNSGLDWPN